MMLPAILEVRELFVQLKSHLHRTLFLQGCMKQGLILSWQLRYMSTELRHMELLVTMPWKFHEALDSDKASLL